VNFGNSFACRSEKVIEFYSHLAHVSFARDVQSLNLLLLLPEVPLDFLRRDQTVACVLLKVSQVLIELLFEHLARARNITPGLRQNFIC